jgi:hypothetical protein
MKHWLLLVLASSSLAAPSAVHAQSGSAYYGLSIGEFAYSEAVIIGQDPFDASADSWRLMIGYQFMEHLAVEGGLGKTGTVRDTATFSSPFLPASSLELGLETELSQILTIRLLGTLPFDSGIMLMGGLSYSDFEQELLFSVNGVPQISAEFSDSQPGYYFGVQYDWDRFAMRLGYEKFDFDGDADAEEVSLTFFYKI